MTRRLHNEDPARAGEINPDLPQFTPLPKHRCGNMGVVEEGKSAYGQTYEDCKDKFTDTRGFPGHPFIPPPMPPDGGGDPGYRVIGVDLSPEREQCPMCGGEGWVKGTRPSPEPEYDVCDVCHGDPIPEGWCIACEAGMPEEHLGLKDIEEAPKDGTVIHIETVNGVNGKPFFSGRASWRSEPKPASYDPLTSQCFSAAFNLTGWLRADTPYRVPGKIIGWTEVDDEK